jgi:hypothetical protein
MPVTEAEYEKYGAFTREKVAEMGSLDFDRDTTLWHYTNGTGLLGILEKGTLRSTQVACVNDSTETLYANRLFRDAVDALLKEQEHDQLSKVFLSRVLEEIKEVPEIPAHAASKFFISCFSELKDDINQWLKYGGAFGENGYAIGFRAEGLLFDPNTLVVRVSYDCNLHRKMAKDAALATLNFYREGLVGDRANNPEVWAAEFFEAWDHAIYRLSPLLKDEGFSAEKEFRMVHELQESELPSIRLLQKETMLGRYMDLEPPGEFIPGLPRLPITKIIVGPGRHKQITSVSVRTRLTQLGYRDVGVEVSKRPVQRP